MFHDPEPVVGLFPGQGAYRPGQLTRAWHDRDASVHAVFSAVDLAAAELLGKQVTPVVFAENPPGPEELLARDPDLFQLAVFGLSVAAHRLLVERGVRFSALMGHSMGELTALVCAGAYTLTDGARLLCHRVAALRDHDSSGGLMLALSCGAERAHRILGLMDHQGLAVAVRNTSARTVVSGPPAGIRTVATVAGAVGLTAVELRSPHPFHNPLLTDARHAFARAARAYEVYPLRTAVYSPVLQRWYRDGDDLADLLALHLVTPLAFDAAVERLYGQGVRVFAELGAGRVLGRLVGEMHPDCVVLQPLDARDEYRAVSDAATYLTGERFDEVRVVRPSPAPEALPLPPTRPEVEPPPERPRALEPSGTPADGPPPGDREAVFGRIRSLYAEALEYPEEVLTEDAELEAELGIDSVKQVELLDRVRRLFDLDERGEGERGPRFGQNDTLGGVVDYVHERVSSGGVRR
ncbi:acyltransferase domain-containing protein [Streptomyces sp. NPDC047061]|uniref:acyltransferase domain-containing protein n=1 Tax=Streptomyces sp. NPDC047061 TaxID=3154605 RepID=UPI0034002C36